MELKCFSKKILMITAAVLLIFSVFSCVTASENSTAAAGGRGSSTPMYYGQGSGETSILAMQAAKKEAAALAAVDLLGRAAASGQKIEIEELMASIKDLDPYVISGSLETIDSNNSEGFYYYLGVRINLSTLASALKSSDILGGQIDGREGNKYSLADRAAPIKAAGAPVEQDIKANKDKPVKDSPEGDSDEGSSVVTVEATAEELAVISEYLNSLTYMVYFNEDTAADPFLTRTAVASANRYLDNNGYEYVDLSQIERIKEDQVMVYEEETGMAVSIIQWIAHKLNADIYIELSLDANSKTENGKFYGSAVINLNCFSASTAEGRGSAVYQTIPPAFSRVSEQDALSNAVSSAVSKGMSEAVAAAENETARAAAKGFKYVLTMMNTEDSRMMRDFEKKLGRSVKNIKRTSYSPEESAFEVYLIGDISMLEDLIYDTAETIPGMDGVMLIMQRGNTITFDTGL